MHKKIPHQLVSGIVMHAGKWLNVFSPKGGIPNVSPRTLITGVKLDFTKHCRVDVGAYVQTHEEPDPTNYMDKVRTTGAIALGSTDNMQGGYKFLSLTTGRVINRRKFTILPITQDVINRVHELASNEDEFIFNDRNYNTLQQDDDSVLTGVSHDENASDSDYNDESTESTSQIDENWNENDNNVIQEQDNVNDNGNVQDNYDDNVRNYDNNSSGSSQDDEDIQSLQSELQRAQEEYEELQNELDTVYEADDEDNNNINQLDTFDNDIDGASVDEQQNLPTEQQLTQTRSGRVVKPRGYLEYTPDFKNIKYDSSNINIGTDLTDSEILGMVFMQIIEKSMQEPDNMGHVFSQYFLHE